MLFQIEGSVFREEFDVRSIGNEFIVSLKFIISSLGEFSESPFLGNDDLLSAGELVLGSSEGFKSVFDVFGFNSDREKNLSNADTGGLAVSLTEGSSHTGLQSISTGARKHFVNTDNVEWMSTDSHVETVFADPFDHVFVGCDTGCFEGL
jgi:hypothetical protein